jgi:hypothetical protein
LANGHSEAHDYPIWLVWEESDLVVERTNSLMATEAVLFQTAASTAIAAFGEDHGKAAFQQWSEMIKRFQGDDREPPQAVSTPDDIRKGTSRGR